MILAGQAGPLRSLLQGSPSLAARFRAVIDFPGYTPGQIAVIFGALVEEAGLTPTPAAQSKAAAVLARAEGDRGSGNARLAVRLLNQATAIQALRVASASGPDRDPAGLHTLSAADIPDELHSDGILLDEYWPGQYLLPGREGRAGLACQQHPPAGPPVSGRGPVGREVIQGPPAVDETG